MIILRSDGTEKQIILGYIGSRKRPSLAIKEGTSIRILASFYSEDTMTEFAATMIELAGEGAQDD